MEVVLIQLGLIRPPRYLRACVAQTRAITGRSPIVVGPWRGRRLRGSKLSHFRDVERLSDMGLRGFWRYSAERLFVLEEVMRTAGLKTCVHIESDVLVYAPPDEYAPWLTSTYGNALAVCPLTADQDTAAILYVGSLDALSRFNSALLELVAMAPHALLERYGGSFANEMRMINILRTVMGLAADLPTTVARALELGSDYVFDPASYGQQVDGIPPAPGVPYAGDHHAIGRELISANYRVIWDAQQRSPRVTSKSDATEYPLANLHIHSKRLKRWTSEIKPPPAPHVPLPIRVAYGALEMAGARVRSARRHRKPRRQ